MVVDLVLQLVWQQLWYVEVLYEDLYQVWYIVVVFDKQGYQGLCQLVVGIVYGSQQCGQQYGQDLAGYEQFYCDLQIVCKQGLVV